MKVEILIWSGMGFGGSDLRGVNTSAVQHKKRLIGTNEAWHFCSHILVVSDEIRWQCSCKCLRFSEYRFFYFSIVVLRSRETGKSNNSFQLLIFFLYYPFFERIKIYFFATKTLKYE